MRPFSPSFSKKKEKTFVEKKKRDEYLSTPKKRVAAGDDWQKRRKTHIFSAAPAHDPWERKSRKEVHDFTRLN